VPLSQAFTSAQEQRCRVRWLILLSQLRSQVLEFSNSYCVIPNMSDGIDGSIPIATGIAARDASIKHIGDFFQLTLSRKNKAEIFEYALDKLNQSVDEADLTLKNLTAWCPDVAAMFSPRSSTTVLDTPFRLIFPIDALAAFNEGLYVRQFLAVSYCWHSDDFPYPGYQPHGHWPFSKPFVDAIISDKDHPREGIWIDQVCIDQNSTVDKQKSVAAMDVLYRSCIRLLVLLEDVTLTEEEARLSEEVNPTKNGWSKGWLPRAELRPTFMSFYDKIKRARWWGRGWCYHEFIANEPWSDKRQYNDIHLATFVMNGPNGSTVKMKWHSIQHIMSSAIDLMSPEALFDSINDFKGWAIFNSFTSKDEKVPGDGASIWSSSIMARHNNVAQTGCQNPADRLSIMINMGGIAISYIGRELRDTDEVLYFSVLIALAAGEVHPLSMIGGQSLCLEQKPTWLQRGVGNETRISKFELGNVRGIHRISTERIELDLIFFNGPWGLKRADDDLKSTYHVFPNLIPTPGVVGDDEDLQSTYHVFPGLIPTTYPGSLSVEPNVGTTPTVSANNDLDIPRRRFLAVCILNGMEYIDRLWKQLNRDVVHGNYNGGIYKDFQSCTTLRAPAERFLTLLSKPSISGLATTTQFDLDIAHLFLTWLTDPRSMYYIGHSIPLQMHCTVGGGQAVMTSLTLNEHFRKGQFENLRVALPTDWIGATCIPLRLWILRPVESEGDHGDVVRWRIVGKALLLGEPDLMAEARANRDREDAVITLKERTVVAG
jgi:hypothetical protein